MVEMGPRALFPQGLPSSLPSALLPRPPQKVLDAVCGGTAVSGRGNTHMTQSWPIRASHFPGHRGWFRDGRVTQVRPIRILPGFCQISWERWSDQGGVISSGRDRPAPGWAAGQQRRDQGRETEMERRGETEMDWARKAETERGRRCRCSAVPSASSHASGDPPPNRPATCTLDASQASAIQVGHTNCRFLFFDLKTDSFDRGEGACVIGS